MLMEVHPKKVAFNCFFDPVNFSTCALLRELLWCQQYLCSLYPSTSQLRVSQVIIGQCRHIASLGVTSSQLTDTSTFVCTTHLISSSIGSPHLPGSLHRPITSLSRSEPDKRAEECVKTVGRSCKKGEKKWNFQREWHRQWRQKSETGVKSQNCETKVSASARGLKGQGKLWHKSESFFWWWTVKGEMRGMGVEMFLLLLVTILTFLAKVFTGTI